MEIKIGDTIKTLIEKKTYWGKIDFIVPKGTNGIVCEVYDDGEILIETLIDSGLPFALVEYKKGEYEKVVD